MAKGPEGDEKNHPCLCGVQGISGLYHLLLKTKSGMIFCFIPMNKYQYRYGMINMASEITIRNWEWMYSWIIKMQELVTAFWET